MKNKKQSVISNLALAPCCMRQMAFTSQEACSPWRHATCKGSSLRKWQLAAPWILSRVRAASSEQSAREGIRQQHKLGIREKEERNEQGLSNAVLAVSWSIGMREDSVSSWRNRFSLFFLSLLNKFNATSAKCLVDRIFNRERNYNKYTIGSALRQFTV